VSQIAVREPGASAQKAENRINFPLKRGAGASSIREQDSRKEKAITPEKISFVFITHKFKHFAGKSGQSNKKRRGPEFRTSTFIIWT
jgi:hypothetical protein